jgi:hypothetical protein
VSQINSEWLRERRELPAALRAEAAANPGGSVAEIDGSQISDPDGYVPVEAIIGVWPVRSDGHATGEFLRNPGHGPVRDDFTRLEAPDHWLGWLPDSPTVAVRAALQDAITDQVFGATVPWIKVVADPVFLTGGVRLPHDPQRIVVRRAALGVPFALAAIPPGGRITVLTGVFTWAAAGLDTPGSRRDRVWFDLGMTREQAEDLLDRRIHELDQQQ